jgi:hypothetical protein
MSRTLLRWLNPAGLVAFVLAGVALGTTLFDSYPLSYLQPDAPLLAVIWCALRRPFIEGGAMTLAFGEIAESHSSSPQGILMCCYMAVYLLARLVERGVLLDRLSSLVILTLFASIVWKLGLLGGLALVGRTGEHWRHTLVSLLPGAAVEGIAAIWVYRWLGRFDAATNRPGAPEPHSLDGVLLEGEGR